MSKKRPGKITLKIRSAREAAPPAAHLNPARQAPPPHLGMGLGERVEHFSDLKALKFKPYQALGGPPPHKEVTGLGTKGIR